MFLPLNVKPPRRVEPDGSSRQGALREQLHVPDQAATMPEISSTTRYGVSAVVSEVPVS